MPCLPATPAEGWAPPPPLHPLYLKTLKTNIMQYLCILHVSLMYKHYYIYYEMRPSDVLLKLLCAVLVCMATGCMDNEKPHGQSSQYPDGKARMKLVY